MVVQQAIGQILRALRQRKGLTQKELASKIQGEVDYSYIGKIERGEQLPSLKMLERLSNALAVPLSSFFQGLGSDETAQREGGEADNEALGRQREHLLLYLVRAVHNDDIPLLIEIVRILNKRRKAQGVGKRETGKNCRLR
ncbi:MAG: helix-turn-helix domain-containing protein [Candidatus Entotheonellia bacterium]